MHSTILLIAAYGICFGLMNDKAKFFTDLLKKIPFLKNDKGTFFDRMFICAYCTGFHCGWVVYLISLLHGSIEVISIQSSAVEALIISFASGIFCYSIDAIVQWFER